MMDFVRSLLGNPDEFTVLVSVWAAGVVTALIYVVREGLR